MTTSTTKSRSKVIARVITLVAALASTVAMVASLLSYQYAKAANTQLNHTVPAKCVGYVARTTPNGEGILVPVNLCAKRPAQDT